MMWWFSYFIIMNWHIFISFFNFLNVVMWKIFLLFSWFFKGDCFHVIKWIIYKLYYYLYCFKSDLFTFFIEDYFHTIKWFIVECLIATYEKGSIENKLRQIRFKGVKLEHPMKYFHVFFSKKNPTKEFVDCQVRLYTVLAFKNFLCQYLAFNHEWSSMNKNVSLKKINVNSEEFEYM